MIQKKQKMSNSLLTLISESLIKLIIDNFKRRRILCRLNLVPFHFEWVS